jgi:hypothetical protein
MNLNIDNYGGKGVVPVFCRNYVSGTAFFVSPTHLLTAGHVLAEYYLDKEATVAVVVEDDYKTCRVLAHQDIPDVAILECVDYICPNEHVLPLLSSKFKEGVDLLIVGYPRELGNGVDYFGVTVKNSRKKADLKGGFDRMVVRTDSFGFNSYEGFSGSPVINDFGMVVGIETDQLYYSLGYLSILAIKDMVEEKTRIKIEERDDLFDNSPYGETSQYGMTQNVEPTELSAQEGAIVAQFTTIDVSNCAIQGSHVFFQSWYDACFYIHDNSYGSNVINTKTKDCLVYYGIEIDIVENYREAIEKITSKNEDGKCPYYAVWIINGPPYEELPDGTKEAYLL